MRYFIELVDYSDCEGIVSNAGLNRRIKILDQILTKSEFFVQLEDDNLFLAKKVAIGSVSSFVPIVQIQHKTYASPYNSGTAFYLSERDCKKFLEFCINDAKDKKTKDYLRERRRVKAEYDNSFRDSKNNFTLHSNYYSIGYILEDTEESYNLFQRIKNNKFIRDEAAASPGSMGFLLEDKE